MSRFFVGQRVRIVGANTFPQFIGMEARISGTHNCPLWGFGYIVEGLPPRPDGFAFHWYDPEHLAPILPSGHCAGDFSYAELMDKCREGVAA